MYVIGTAGHVDHGKSLLVEALTGIDPDRLHEEKARGLTIDLGFAWLTLPSGRDVSIVDVPGHERFIKNMLAGAGGIDIALLVVAADDGVMPQTREHLAILDLLGVRRGVVALTKSDVADDDWLSLIEVDIAEILAATTLEGSAIVRCSAVTRVGLDHLVRELDNVIDELPEKRDIGRPRLPVDRVFTIGGFGTVVTGTLIDGELEVGTDIELVPSEGLHGRVRGLQSHGKSVERARPGTRTAVNIAGVPKHALRRGMVLTSPGTVRPTDVVDARVRVVRAKARPLRHNMALTFHLLADEANARLRLLATSEVRAGEEAWAQLKLGSPVAAVRGDHFVLRTAADTVAGGVIVDTSPRRHRRHEERTIAALEAMLSESPEQLTLAAIDQRPLMTRRDVARAVRLAPHVVEGAVDSLIASAAVVAVGVAAGARLAMPSFLRGVESRAAETVAAYHREHPLRSGMPREELRARIGLEPAAFDLLSATWSAVRTDPTHLALASFSPSPDPEQSGQIDAYVASLHTAGGHGSSSAIEPELLAYLVERRCVVDAGGGVVFDAHTFEGMTSKVGAHIASKGAITLAEARDLFATGRKQAQAALEHMDRMKVTRRVGDLRVLR